MRRMSNALRLEEVRQAPSVATLDVHEKGFALTYANALLPGSETIIQVKDGDVLHFLFNT